jgi:hypothetical protein
MGSPYLSTDESIILSAHDLVINTVSSEAILTNQRLMLVDKTHPRLLPQDIPFTAIETVTIGENSGNDPVLSLSIATPDGTRQPLGMIFPEGPRANRMSERDEWATRIRELSVIAQHESGIVALELLPPWVPGPIPDDLAVDNDTEVVPAGTRFKGPSLSERRSRAAGSSTTRKIGIAAAILVVIAVVVVGIFFYAPSIVGQSGTPATPTPAPTMVPTTAAPAPTTPVTPPVEEPPVVPTPAVTTVPTALVSGGIPQTGVWVRVKYDGTFAGTVGAPGRFRDVTGSGDRFFQIPARDEFVSAAIQKLDNSGNPLTVEFYNEGVMVQTATITKPRGILNLDVNLKTVATPVVTLKTAVAATGAP